MLLVCSDFIKIVLDCLYLRGNDSLYSAYFEVHFQNQIKVVPNTKFSKFCLKSLMKNLLTDLQEWPEIVT